jgi:hypothetical protein
VNNGLAIACVVTPSENNPSSHGVWQASCPISQDGNFAFEDLPVGELRVIALCEGAVSTPTKGFSVVLDPQKFGSQPTVPIEVKMSSTGTLKVKVADVAGAPIPSAHVTWNITQNFDNFNGWGFGMTTADSAPVVRVLQDTPSARLPSIEIRGMRATTNADGEVAIANLPPMPLGFYVHAKGCERVFEKVRIKSGDANTLSVRLKPDGAAASGGPSPSSSPHPAQKPVPADRIPYGSQVDGKPGFVTSPYSPFSGNIDVHGFPPGTEVKDPYSGKIFLTP